MNHVMMSIVAWQQLKCLLRKKNIQSSMRKTLEILEIYMSCLILNSKTKQICNFSTETSIFFSAGYREEVKINDVYSGCYISGHNVFLCIEAHLIKVKRERAL